MLTSKLLDKVAEMGEARVKDIEISKSKDRTTILRRLWKRELLEREDTDDTKRTCYKYTLSDKGREMIDKFGSYKNYKFLSGVAMDLTRLFDDKENFAQRIKGVV